MEQFALRVCNNAGCVRTPYLGDNLFAGLFTWGGVGGLPIGSSVFATAPSAVLKRFFLQPRSIILLTSCKKLLLFLNCMRYKILKTTKNNNYFRTSNPVLCTVMLKDSFLSCTVLALLGNSGIQYTYIPTPTYMKLSCFLYWKIGSSQSKNRNLWYLWARVERKTNL